MLKVSAERLLNDYAQTGTVQQDETLRKYWSDGELSYAEQADLISRGWDAQQVVLMAGSDGKAALRRRVQWLGDHYTSQFTSDANRMTRVKRASTSLPLLTQVIHFDRDPWIRQVAVEALGTMRGPEVIPLLCHAATADPARLAREMPGNATGWQLLAMQQLHERSCIAAIHAMGTYSHTHVVEALKQILQQPASANIQTAAIEVAAQSNDVALLPALQIHLGNPYLDRGTRIRLTAAIEAIRQHQIAKR